MNISQINKYLSNQFKFKAQFNIQNLTNTKEKLQSASIVACLENWIKRMIRPSQWWIILFENITECYVESFYLYKSATAISSQDIIILMPKVNFTKIKELTIHYNSLKNINFLQALQCQSLKTLDISNNNIIEVKSLRKCKLPNLSQIIFSFNAIKQISQHSFLENKSLQSLQIIANQIQNVSFAFKIKQRLLLQDNFTKIKQKLIRLQFKQALKFHQKYDKLPKKIS